MKILGFDDGVHTCDCCGRSDLKGTFAVELESGDVLYYGSVCVTRHTGKTAPAVRAEAREHERAEAERKARALWNHPAAVALRERQQAAHALRLVGRPFKDFCAAELAAEQAARREIYG